MSVEREPRQQRMTLDDCNTRVASLLDARPVVITCQEHLDTRQRLVDQLAEMIPECTPALELRAQELLASFSSGAEPLSMILDAMAQRDLGDVVAPFAIAAITAPGSAEREPFVELLEDLGRDEAVPVLAEALAHYDDDSDPDGFLRRRILRAFETLGGAELAAIEGALAADGCELLRELAIRTIDQLDMRAAAPALVRCLEVDDDPCVLARAAGLLAQWHERAAQPALEALAASNHVLCDEELRVAVDKALATLR